jgi:hypothetical protein
MGEKVNKRRVTMIRKCIVPDCKRMIPHGSICSTHFYRFQKYGSYKLPPTMIKGDAPIEKLLNSISVNEKTGCWEWNRKYKKSNRYPKITVGKYKAQTIHRFMYEHCNGKIPDGLIICHKCDNVICCNPEHLFAGTHRDNAIDMVSKNRRRYTDKRYLKLNDEMVLAIFKDKRMGKEIAKAYGVDATVVSKIKQKKYKIFERTVLRGE